MYSNGFEIEIHNKTLEITTFGIQFPKETFISFTQNANDKIQRFSECMLSGKSAILSEKWGALDFLTEQVIFQIIHCNYSEELKNHD
jgi:AraC family transcriptional regulator, transcriptional activator of the genes for pyochelin and ferripyochelin receptors